MDEARQSLAVAESASLGPDDYGTGRTAIVTATMQLNKAQAKVSSVLANIEDDASLVLEEASEARRAKL
jgi:hypothetical protein